MVEEFQRGAVVGIRDIMRYIWGWGDGEYAAVEQYYEDVHTVRNYARHEGVTYVDGFICDGVDAFTSMSNRQEVTGVVAVAHDRWRVDDPARLRWFAEDLRRHFVQHGERGHSRRFGSD